MTNRWTKGDLAALDELLSKYPLTEIVAKAKRRTRRPAGRPGYDFGDRFSVYMSIEIARGGGVLNVQEAAEKVAAGIKSGVPGVGSELEPFFSGNAWQSPVTAKSLVRIHRQVCGELEQRCNEGRRRLGLDEGRVKPTYLRRVYHLRGRKLSAQEAAERGLPPRADGRPWTEAAPDLPEHRIYPSAGTVIPPRDPKKPPEKK